MLYVPIYFVCCTNFIFIFPLSKYNDPRTVNLKNNNNVIEDTNSLSPSMSPIQICNRLALLPPDIELQAMQQYASCPLLNNPPEQTTVILLDGSDAYGRIGNNLIEFLHALQYGRDINAVVGIMIGSWPTHLITNMWMAIQNDDMVAWGQLMERSLCVKMINTDDQLNQYKQVIRMDTKEGTKELFTYQRVVPLNDYVDFQSHLIRALWKSYNNGTGLNMRHRPVHDMCSVLDAIFGREAGSIIYSVVHSRSLEGPPGIELMRRIAKNTGCDPLAALEMEPEYVKAILEPLGMLKHPIIFMTDHQRPKILERLLADPDIGSNIHLVPSEASWVGGDITVALMANVFIGNPASTFSGFIAKSRVALGYNNNYLFRRREKNGTWVDVCDYRCVFDKKVLNSMA